MTIPFKFAMIELDLHAKKKWIDGALKNLLKGKGLPSSIEQILSYALLGEGKRLRPAFVLWSVEAFGGSSDRVLKGACGIECLHAFSLIHDDLPGLDDSPVRRGRPSCHRAFGLGQAILAGDALFALGYQWIAENLIEEKVAAGGEILKEVAEACGAGGMIGGQFEDISPRQRKLEEWLDLYEKKTARLFQLSVFLGAAIVRAEARQIEILKKFGLYFGLAFQLMDDFADADSTKEPSLVRSLGSLQGKQLFHSFLANARETLDGFQGNPSIFLSLIDYLGEKIG